MAEKNPKTPKPQNPKTPLAITTNFVKLGELRISC